MSLLCQTEVSHELTLELHSGSQERLIYDLYDEDGQPSQLGPTDKVLWILRDEDGVELLSVTETDNSGSVVVINTRGSAGVTPAQAMVTIAMAHAVFETGQTWELRIELTGGQQEVVAHGGVVAFP